MSTERVYVATSSSEAPGERDGILMFERDPASGGLEPTPVHAPSSGATFLALHPSGRYLYATSNEQGGAVAALRIGPDGDLFPLGSVPTGGAGTCHVAVHPSGRYLVSADYASGHVAVHRVAGDGSLGERCDLVAGEGSGPDPERQTSSHAHCCWPDPGGRFVLAVDLGTDEVRTYGIDAATGRLVQASAGSAEPGSGPRHLVWHPDGYLLVTGELASSLMTFDYDPSSGAARLTASVPATTRTSRRGENYPSEPALGAGGRFCYVANRGADSIGAFRLGGGPPRLVSEVSCEGHWPRHLAVIGEHLYVANQDSGTLAVFALDPVTGVPRPTGAVEVHRPFCVLAGP